MNLVKLYVKGELEAQFSTDSVPQSENDLLGYKAYTDFYYRVGLGAPVVAKVVKGKGLFRATTTFEFTIHGNAISFEELEDKIKKYSTFYICEEMNVDAENRIIQMTYSFVNDGKALEMYHDIEGICNVGAYYFRKMGKNIIRVDFHIR